MKEVILFIVLAFSFQLFAQDQIVFKAMTDEMNRNLDSLQRDENKPFYISYSLSTSKVQTVNAVFGSLTNADEQVVRGWNSRVMVGDYLMNDENYSDDQDLDVAYLSYPSIPLEDNYLAIRRFFWIGTNNIFEEASRLYNSKKENLKRHGITYTIPDFDQVAPTQLYVKNEASLEDLDNVKSFVSRLSKEFNAHSEIMRSAVNWNAVSSDIYYKNSEGTSYQIPFNLVVLTVSADVLDDEGNFHNDNFSVILKSSQELISSYDDIKTQLNDLVITLKRKSVAENSLDSYYGPVILANELTASFFLQNLNGRSGGITGYRDMLNMQSKQQALNYFKEFEKSAKLEERIAVSGFNVYALPKATTFRGEPLMGTVIIDGEGVIPPDTIHIVKDGVINERLNSRTPIPKAMKSNGHSLNQVFGGNLSKSVSPSNLLIDYKIKFSLEELKANLMEKVKQDGLEFGLLIRPAYSGSNSLVEMVKIFADGKEEIILTTAPALNQSNILKRILGTSNDYKIVNNPGSSNYVGRPQSIISASYVLVDGFEIGTSDSYRYNDGYIPSIPMPSRKQ
jgi:hypothetical protein